MEKYNFNVTSLEMNISDFSVSSYGLFTLDIIISKQTKM